MFARFLWSEPLMRCAEIQPYTRNICGRWNNVAWCWIKWTHTTYVTAFMSLKYMLVCILKLSQQFSSSYWCEAFKVCKIFERSLMINTHFYKSMLCCLVWMINDVSLCHWCVPWLGRFVLLLSQLVLGTVRFLASKHTVPGIWCKRYLFPVRYFLCNKFYPKEIKAIEITTVLLLPAYFISSSHT